MKKQLSFAFATEPPPAPRKRKPAPAPRLSTRPLFVVPTERHVERFTVAGYDALTLPSLEERLLVRLAPDLAVASRAEERTALRAALVRLKKRISSVDPSAPAFVSVCESALDDLFARVVVLDPTLVVGPFASRVRWLRALSDTVKAELALHGLCARRDAPLALAERVASLDPATVVEALGTNLIETRSLVDLGPRTLALLQSLDRKLSRLGGRASVSLPMFERPLDLERPRDPLETVATWAASWLDDAPRTEIVPARLGTLDGDPVPPEAAMEVSHASALDEDAHAHAIAACVSERLRRGARVDAVVVAYARRDEPMLLALARAFDEAGIVAHGLPKPPSALIAFVFEALAALTGSVRDLGSLFGSPYVDLGLHPRDARRRLSRLSKKLSTAPRARAESPREALFASYARAVNGRVVEEETAILTRIVDIFGRFPERGTVPVLVAATLDYLAVLGVERRAIRADPSVFSSDERDPIESLERDAVARDARAFSDLVEALSAMEQAARLDPEAVVERGRFVEELATLVGLAAPLPGAARSFAVRVGRLQDFAGEELDLLVVADATTRGLAGAPPRSPLVTSELLRALDPRGASSQAAEDAKVMAALGLAAARAREVVMTSYGAEGDEAVDVAPQVAKLVEAGAPSEAWGAVSRLDKPLTRHDVRIRSLLLGADPPSELAERVHVERTREHFFLDERRPASTAIGTLGALLGEDLKASLSEETGGERPLALTGLERFAECGFRGFAHVVLGARDPAEEAELPTAREEGTRLHGALAVALEAAKPHLRRRPRDASAVQEAGMAAARRYLVSHATESALESVLDLRVMHAVMAVLREAVEDETWDFEAAEASFGEASDPASLPALVLGENELSLRGRIDRVDVGRARASARVVDYKRSSIRDIVKKVGTTALQVPLYAMAVQKPLAVLVVKGIYYSLRESELSKRPGPKDTGELAVDRALERGQAVDVALRAVRRVRSADVSPRPWSDTQCRACGFSGGCRRPRFAMPAEEEETQGGEA